MTFPFKIPVVRIAQPLGEFYVGCFDSDLLLQVAYTDPLRVTDQATEETYPLVGTQREESEKRKKEIGRFIETVEAAFPNSVILAANYTKDGELEDADERRWRIEETKNGTGFSLVIPSSMKLASVVDGQHRLYGFEYASKNTPMNLLCSVYLDLPRPYQAYLFATINSNQKKVDRSLAYELWGFQLENEPPESWSPEKAAVFLTRKLNVEESSPLHRRVIVAAQDDQLLFRNRPENVTWVVSTATIVDGILRLISSDPKKDRDLLHTKKVGAGRKRKLLEKDHAPLRSLYLDINDLAIYTALTNFFGAADDILWRDAPERSFIKKTVGLQALYDVMRLLLKDFDKKKDISKEFFAGTLSPARSIDFSSDFFSASGVGRTRVKNAILLATGLKAIDDVVEGDRDSYSELLGRSSH